MKSIKAEGLRNHLSRIRFFRRQALIGCFLIAISGTLNSAFCQETTQYSYDGQGRLIQADYRSGHGFRYAYDSAGNIIHIRQVSESGIVVEPGGEESPPAVAGNRISGKVFRAGTTEPPSMPAVIRLFTGESCTSLELVTSMYSDPADGSYVFENLPPGGYFILVVPSEAGSAPGWFSADGAGQDCSEAQKLILAQGVEAGDMDVPLEQDAAISGTVLEDGGAVPEDTGGILVKVFAGNACAGPLVKTAPVNAADGRFIVQGLRAGTYYVYAEATESGYRSQWWSETGDAHACLEAEAVTVAAGEQIDSLDIRLEPGRSIGGTIYQTNGTTPLTGETVIIEAFRDDACAIEPAASALIDEATGNYTIRGLAPGDYFLKARAFTGGYIEEWWSETGDAFNCLQAEGLTLNTESDLSNVNLNLDLGGVISGTIYEGDGVTPVTAPLVIEFYRYQVSFTRACGTPLVTYTNPASGGFYRQALPAGRYFMRVNPTGTPYAFSWWNGTGGNLSCEDANDINLQAGAEVTGRNFRLQPASTIRGRITQSDGVTPVEAPIQIIAYSNDPCNLREITRGAYDPETGQYIVDNLSNGAVTILVSGEGTAYADEWWSEAGDAYFCFQAQHIQIVNNQDVTDRDFSLEIGADISGAVYQKDGQTPVDQAVSVGLYPENACGSYRKIKTVSSDPVTGRYAFERQGPGSYTLLADLPAASPYIDEWWSEPGDAFLCQDAEVFTLSPGIHQTDKDFHLDRKSTISGSLFKPDGSTMNISFSVLLYQGDPCGVNTSTSVTSNRFNGTFSFSNVKPGRYYLFVNTRFNTYSPEWWSSDGNAFACGDASEIVVPSGEDIANLEIHLDEGAKISGTVYQEDGVTPVTDYTAVRLYRGDPCAPQLVTTVYIDTGSYEFKALPPGTYYISTSMAYYFDRWWSPSYDARGCQDAQSIVVADVGDSVADTDVRLKEKGAISGKVYQLDGATPVTGTMYVYLYEPNSPENPVYLSAVKVSADGGYSLRGVDAGSCLLRAYYAYSDFVPEWWSAAGGAFSWTEAEEIALTDGEQVEGIDFSLHEKGRISGKVLQIDGTPIASETIYVYAFSGESACTADYQGYATASQTDGSYRISGLEPGTYFLRTNAAYPADSAFIPEWWSGNGPVFECTGASPIPVGMDQTVTDRDFNLYDCGNFPDRAPNDNFEDAVDLPVIDGTRKTNNFCATAEDGEPDHAAYGNGAKASLWWRWTATRTEETVFKTEGSSFDTVLSVYTGDAADDLTLVAQNDNHGFEIWSRVSFNAEESQNYMICVDTADWTLGTILLTYGKEQTMLGDVNRDGSVDLLDAILVMQILAKVTDTGSDVGGDVNDDGRIGLAEAIFILQKVAEVR